MLQMFVWSLSLYNIIEFKVPFFYAKSRTCSFIVQYLFSVLTHFSVNRIIELDTEYVCYQNIARPPLAAYK